MTRFQTSYQKLRRRVNDLEVENKRLAWLWDETRRAAPETARIVESRWAKQGGDDGDSRLDSQ